MRSPFEELPKEQRDAWLIDPTTERYLATVRRTLSQIQTEIILQAEGGDFDVERMRTLGAQAAALRGALRLATNEVSRDVA